MTDANTARGYAHIHAVLGAWQYRVWAHICDTAGKDGVCRNELDRALAKRTPNGSASRRLRELERLGLVVRDGSRLDAVSGHRAARYFALAPRRVVPVVRRKAAPSAVRALGEIARTLKADPLYYRAHPLRAAKAIDMVREIVARAQGAKS